MTLIYNELNNYIKTILEYIQENNIKIDKQRLEMFKKQTKEILEIIKNINNPVEIFKKLDVNYFNKMQDLYYWITQKEENIDQKIKNLIGYYPNAIKK